MTGSIKKDRENLEIVKRSSFLNTPTQNLNLNIRKYCNFTYEIFDIISEIVVFIFDIGQSVSDFEIFFNRDEKI